MPCLSYQFLLGEEIENPRCLEMDAL
jgi:hypothetical protein